MWSNLVQTNENQENVPKVQFRCSSVVVQLVSQFSVNVPAEWGMYECTPALSVVCRLSIACTRGAVVSRSSHSPANRKGKATKQATSQLQTNQTARPCLFATTHTPSPHKPSEFVARACCGVQRAELVSLVADITKKFSRRRTSSHNVRRDGPVVAGHSLAVSCWPTRFETNSEGDNPSISTTRSSRISVCNWSSG
jgi:hypothetical protein